MILGMAFCECKFHFFPSNDRTLRNDTFFFFSYLVRNAYMLINFGNLVNAATPSSDTAYIQLLPMTDAAKAAQDFLSVRQNGTGYAEPDDLGILLHSTPVTTGSRSPLASWVVSVIAGGVILFILIMLCACCCCRRRRAKTTVVVPVNVWTGYSVQSYRPIYEPSPQAATDMHVPAPAYTPAYVPEYKTAWDSRP
jgi:hypothetical protein